MRFKFFEIMKVTLLHWFAAQQQTSTFRRQKVDSFYPKFSAKLNDLTVNVRGRIQKIPKTNSFLELTGFSNFVSTNAVKARGKFLKEKR